MTIQVIFRYTVIPVSTRVLVYKRITHRDKKITRRHDPAQVLPSEPSPLQAALNFAHRPVICASKPILEYELLLEDCSFVRVHKSFLVNLVHVTEYIRGEGGMVILSDKANIEVSRRKKDLLIARMKQYYKF